MKPKGDTAGKEHPALSRPVLVHGVMAACLEKSFGTINPPCIPCRQWLCLSSQHLLYLLSYLEAALCIQADAVPGSYPKRASLSMWWREEIKFYTVMYWCLKHETDVSFFSRRIWYPPFSILIGRQCNWHPLMIKRNCCSWCLVKVWRRPAHQTLHHTGYGDEGIQNMRDQSR